MPPGGEGYYYFSVYLLGENAKVGRFNIEINGNRLCTARLDEEQTIDDYPQSACSAATYAVEGKKTWK